MMFGFSMFATSLVIPQLVQLPQATGYGLGRSMLVAGLTMVPSGLVMMAAAPISAIISRRYGTKTTLMIGALIVAIGYGGGTIFMDEVRQLAIVSGVIGAGIGFAYGAMPALIMSAVPVSETAAANSFNTLVRSIGTSMSSAVAGAVLAASATTFGTVSVPSQDGFRIIMALAPTTALLALLIAAFLPRQRQHVTSGRHAAPLGDARNSATRRRCATNSASAPWPPPLVPWPRLTTSQGWRSARRQAVAAASMVLSLRCLPFPLWPVVMAWSVPSSRLMVILRGLAFSATGITRRSTPSR